MRSRSFLLFVSFFVVGLFCGCTHTDRTGVFDGSVRNSGAQHGVHISPGVVAGEKSRKMLCSSALPLLGYSDDAESRLLYLPEDQKEDIDNLHRLQDSIPREFVHILDHLFHNPQTYFGEHHRGVRLLIKWCQI